MTINQERVDKEESAEDFRVEVVELVGPVAGHFGAHTSHTLVEGVGSTRVHRDLARKWSSWVQRPASLGGTAQDAREVRPLVGDLDGKAVEVVAGVSAELLDEALFLLEAKEGSPEEEALETGDLLASCEEEEDLDALELVAREAEVLDGEGDPGHELRVATDEDERHESNRGRNGTQVGEEGRQAYTSSDEDDIAFEDS